MRPRTMSGLRVAASLLAALALATEAPARQSPVARRPEAMVARVHGTVRVAAADASRTLRLFDRLSEGDTLRLADAAEVVLVFRTGARVRLVGAGDARVRAGVVTATPGIAEVLSPVPTVPLVAPVPAAGAAIAAVRVRAEAVRATAPAADEALVAGDTTLAFEPAGAESYDVEVMRPDATIVFRQRTSATRVVLPASHVDAGTSYRWRVTARFATGFVAVVESSFRTLPAEAARERAALRAAVGETDAVSRALLAEVDYTLGLWREALAQFKGARAAGAVDAVIGERIAALERLLTAAPKDR